MFEPETSAATALSAAESDIVRALNISKNLTSILTQFKNSSK